MPAHTYIYIYRGPEPFPGTVFFSRKGDWAAARKADKSAQNKALQHLPGVQGVESRCATFQGTRATSQPTYPLPKGAPREALGHTGEVLEKSTCSRDMGGY